MADDFFPWKDEYSVGIPVIDQDHQELFRIVNALHQSIADAGAPSSEQLRELTDRLIHYVQAHFEREEHLMTANHYPHIKAHRQKHHDFIRFVYALKKIELEEPETIDPEKLRDFLKSWLEKHILNADREYIPFIHNAFDRRKSDDAALGDVPAPADSEQEFVTVSVQVPYSEVNTLRRCARLLRLGGAGAQSVNAASDPLGAFNMEDARVLANIIIRKA